MTNLSIYGNEIESKTVDFDNNKYNALTSYSFHLFITDIYPKQYNCKQWRIQEKISGGNRKEEKLREAQKFFDYSSAAISLSFFRFFPSRTNSTTFFLVPNYKIAKITSFSNILLTKFTQTTNFSPVYAFKMPCGN